MLEPLLSFGKKIIPKPVFELFAPVYHFLLAVTGATIYRFPAHSLFVIAVTGTKGKTSTAEIVNAILEEAGIRTALAGTLRFKIGETSKPNKFKMTMPGRFVIQKFLRKSVDAGCTHVILEVTSQAVLQHRHRFLYPDALVFTNLAPEHIESHGTYENYIRAKLKIAEEVARSGKPRTMIIANADDKEGTRFLAVAARETYPYSLQAAEPYEATDAGIDFTFEGVSMHSPLPGLFNLYNLLAGATLAKALGIDAETVKRAVAKLSRIRGRAEKIEEGQPFTVVVDYAHTVESLEALYGAFTGSRNICVLGNTGGGRDTWKRPEMARTAERHCDEVILTNEDPYDEDPGKIIAEMAAGMQEKKPHIILDRREAIRSALEHAKPGDNVLITGKGTDPYIMEAGGKKTPWDDATVCREELRSVLGKNEETVL
jgi:UDP-N-acetylmuramoyl-L-alanyl-D-glutamate--2,6-diaminopimelate ligase